MRNKFVSKKGFSMIQSISEAQYSYMEPVGFEPYSMGSAIRWLNMDPRGFDRILCDFTGKGIRN